MEKDVRGIGLGIYCNYLTTFKKVVPNSISPPIKIELLVVSHHSGNGVYE